MSFFANFLLKLRSAVHIRPHDKVVDLQKQQTCSKLKCLNVSGVLYFVLITMYIFSLTYHVTLKTVVEEEEAQVYYKLGGIFILFNVVMNFFLINYYDSAYLEQVPDDGAPGLPNMSWKKCIDCEQSVPPRAHHCVLCKKCILKRDHHCFFTGNCIGFSNQRFFVVFCFYSAVGCAYAFYINWQYTVFEYSYPLSWHFYQYVLPVTVFRWLLGYHDYWFLCTVILLYVCAMTSFGASGICAWQMFLISTGLTTHEFTTTGITRRHKGVWSQFRDVFGPYWVVNFLLPVPFLKSKGNGMDWDSTKNV